MKLNEQSLEWSLEHLVQYGDTDLFPRAIEFDVLSEIKSDVVKKLKELDLGNYKHGASRKFIVPKNELAVRSATQLNPLDSIILTSIIYEYGENIEKRRIPTAENKVFSYRFEPQSDWTLYNPNISWADFWTHCQTKSEQYEYAVYLDITDFYNQIYHHTIENQLIASEFPNQIKKWIINLLESITAKVSRGIPIGSHSTHLLAEMSLIPIDNNLSNRGIEYCRYVDDIVIFCNTYEEARILINEMAYMLDQQQRLTLQNQKTKAQYRFQGAARNQIIETLSG